MGEQKFCNEWIRERKREAQADLLSCGKTAKRRSGRFEVARNSGARKKTCPYCGKRYTRTNFMVRRDVYDSEGQLLGDTHLIKCARMAGKMPEVSCYTMDLYCDHQATEHEHGEFPHTFTGRTNAECKREAKAAGWKWHANGGVSCPKCQSKGQPENAGQF